MEILRAVLPRLGIRVDGTLAVSQLCVLAAQKIHRFWGQLQGGDSSLSAQVGLPPALGTSRKDGELLVGAQRRPRRWSQGWSPSALGTAWESWGSSARRGGGSQDTLLQLFYT